MMSLVVINTMQLFSCHHLEIFESQCTNEMRNSPLSKVSWC
uniref:Uncharacterized protein n=1 Tax=Rhizophora mucronata TaxID=61149 RepID=A0A2P2Q6V9_RHIMU